MPAGTVGAFRKRNMVWKAGTPKSYFWCVDQYGWPLLGKAFSKLKAHRINIDCFLNYSESKSEKDDLMKYYDILRQVKISQACCDFLKKEPSEKKQIELDVDVIFKGLMRRNPGHGKRISPREDTCLNRAETICRKVTAFGTAIRFPSGQTTIYGNTSIALTCPTPLCTTWSGRMTITTYIKSPGMGAWPAGRICCSSITTSPRSVIRIPKHGKCL